MRILKVLRTAVLFTVIFAVASVLATLAWREYLPVYTSTALMEVQPQETSAIRPERVALSTGEMDRLARTYAGLVSSEAVLSVALRSGRVRETDWFKKDPDGALERLTKAICVRPVHKTHQIRVSLRGFDARDLAEIVNAVAEAAQADSLEVANRSRQDQIRQLQAEKTTLTESRDRDRAEKAKLIHDADVPNMLDPTNALTVKLQNLLPQITAAELDLADCDSRLRYSQALVEGSGHLLPQALEFVERDPVVCALLLRRAEILAEDAGSVEGKARPDALPVLPPLPPEEPGPGTQPGKADAGRPDQKARAAAQVEEAMEALKTLPGSPAAQTQPAKGETGTPGPLLPPARTPTPGRPQTRPTKAEARPSGDKARAAGDIAEAMEELREAFSGLPSPRTRPGKADGGVSGRRARLAAIDSQIEDRRKHLGAAVAQCMAADAETRKAIALERLAKLREQYRFVDMSVRGLQATLAAYNELDARVKKYDERIARIDDRLTDLRILLKGDSPLVLRRTASTPLEPSCPKWEIVVPVGTGVGLVLGLLFGLVRQVCQVRGPRRGAPEPPVLSEAPSDAPG